MACAFSDEKFAKIRFFDEGNSVVPKNWLIESKNKQAECWWPAVKDPSKLIAECVSPKSKNYPNLLWNKLEVEVVLWCDNDPFGQNQAGRSEDGNRIDATKTDRDVQTTTKQFANITLQPDTKDRLNKNPEKDNLGLPLETEEELKEFEDNLKDSEFKTKFKMQLTKSLRDGEDLKHKLSTLLEKVFHDTLAERCSWKGRMRNGKKKIPVFNLITIKLISDVVHASPGTPGINVGYTIYLTHKEYIIGWFSHAKERLQKLLNKGK